MATPLQKAEKDSDDISARVRKRIESIHALSRPRGDSYLQAKLSSLCIWLAVCDLELVRLKLASVRAIADAQKARDSAGLGLSADYQAAAKALADFNYVKTEAAILGMWEVQRNALRKIASAETLDGVLAVLGDLTLSGLAAAFHIDLVKTLADALSKRDPRKDEATASYEFLEFLSVFGRLATEWATTAHYRAIVLELENADFDNSELIARTRDEVMSTFSSLLEASAPPKRSAKDE